MPITSEISITESCRYFIVKEVLSSSKSLFSCVDLYEGMPIPGYPDSGKVRDSFSLGSKTKGRRTVERINTQPVPHVIKPSMAGTLSTPRTGKVQLPLHGFLYNSLAFFEVKSYA